MKKGETRIATIVIPTTDMLLAANTGTTAIRLAGVSCNLIIVATAERTGYVIPANAAIAAARKLNAEYTCFMNDDTHITQNGWLFRMIEALEEDKLYGIACPGGYCRGGPQTTVKPGEQKAVQVVKHPQAWFLAVVKRAALEKLEEFDPVFTHYAHDSDAGMRVREAGWLSILVRDVFVVHGETQTANEWWNQDRAIYKKKWGGRK